MNEDIKKEWVRRLRSKDYKQGQNVLRHEPLNGPTEYCCLGVLCEIAVEAGIAERTGLPGSDEFDDLLRVVNYKTVLDDRETELPLEVYQWAGLPDDNPCVNYVDPEYGSQRDSLAELNDGGYTFEQLAMLIEEQF